MCLLPSQRLELIGIVKFLINYQGYTKIFTIQSVIWMSLSIELFWNFPVCEHESNNTLLCEK